MADPVGSVVREGGERSGEGLKVFTGTPVKARWEKLGGGYSTDLVV